jgi:uncharacterized protein DUF5681
MSNYKIGRGKPPKKYSWTKGTSGNPHGRPKGRRNLSTTIEATLREKTTIEENGKERTVTKLEAMVRRLIEAAISGQVQSLRTLAILLPADESAPPLKLTDLEEQDRRLLESLSHRLTDPKTNIHHGATEDTES